MKDNNLLSIVSLGLTSIIALVSIYLSCKGVDTLERINNRINRANVEYQFVVTDSTITVWDKNRYVGEVKLDGQLDSLIVADNE